MRLASRPLTAAPLLAFVLLACRTAPAPTAAAPSRPRIVFDSDANNELDDQHAIAYLLWNAQHWTVEGITTNATDNGGSIAEQSAEARRVVHLSGLGDRIPVIDGANGDFESARAAAEAGQPGYDGKAAVDFILERSRVPSAEPLVILAVGKLTNVALALAVDPTLAARARLVWLGSNWPIDAKEYNEANDRPAVNFVLDSRLPFDIVTVRPPQRGGTHDVLVSLDEIRAKMPGRGPKVPAIAGRHGGAFTSFGDYSVELFEKMGDAKRALFDMAAVAIVKNPAWAKAQTVPAPRIEGEAWVERPDNPRTVRFFERFDRDGIVADFFITMHAPRLPGS